MSEYIVHKAVELNNVHAKRKAVLSEPGYLESNFIAQAKYDGCNCIIIIRESDDNWQATVLSRTGEVVKSMDHVSMALAMLPDVQEGVYLGEAWCPDASFAEISGWFRRQTPDEDTCRLQFAIFDYLTLDEWEAGESALNYCQRTNRLPNILSSIPQARAPLWLAQTFGKIKERWPGETAQSFANKLVAQGGYDGLILRDPDGKWVRGKGTTGEIIKVKPLVRFTLRVIDYVPGKGKHEGKIGSLVVSYNGKPMGAGTGLKDSERSVGEFETRWLDKLVDIEALGFSEDGLLREPRLKGVRDDVLVPDA